MSIIASLTAMFKASPSTKPVDQYNILSPLIATGDYITKTKEAVLLIKDTELVKNIRHGVVDGKYPACAADAYKTYVAKLGSHEQLLEKASPLASLLLALESINGNLVTIEDNFASLFGAAKHDDIPKNLKSSSIVVIGYLERANDFATWVATLIEHLTADKGDLIPPFRSKELLAKAASASEFAVLNLNKWNYKSSGFMVELKELQRKGADLTLQSSDGEWLDDFASDTMFSPVSQELITAAMRSPITMLITFDHVRRQNKIDLYTARKDWLTSKIILEEAKLQNMDPTSPEYKRLKKAVDHYAALVSKYEQKIERKRG